MKNNLFLMLVLMFACGFAQDNKQDSVKAYKKRVLDKIEIDFLSSYYRQDGANAAVTGGIGTEELTDFATDIVVSIPLNDDDVLTIGATASAYTSASSSNLDPSDLPRDAVGSPWIESTGDSQKDIWFNANVSYSHSSDDRNKIWNVNANFAIEYDYLSIGVGGGHTWLFNEKNTEFGVKGNVFLDTWNPQYPTELDSYVKDPNLNSSFFAGVDIFDQEGLLIDKDGVNIWSPLNATLIENKNRNTFSASLSFSQIISKNAQFALFLDIVQQEGWLASPLQRVYFGDRPNFYIGNPASIPNYTSPTNIDVFQLGDDIERLPNSRFKIPIGGRFNYYINEVVVARTYYRFYSDNWGVTSHTAEIELPIKISDKFTLYPSYRYYTQTAADYFAPYEQNLSTQEFYTSDYDLSDFTANQYGFGIKYTDIFTKFRIWKFALKSAELKYSHYDRSTGLSSDIISFGLKYIVD